MLSYITGSKLYIPSKNNHSKRVCPWLPSALFRYGHSLGALWAHHFLIICDSTLFLAYSFVIYADGNWEAARLESPSFVAVFSCPNIPVKDNMTGLLKILIWSAAVFLPLSHFGMSGVFTLYFGGNSKYCFAICTRSNFSYCHGLHTVLWICAKTSVRKCENQIR